MKKFIYVVATFSVLALTTFQIASQTTGNSATRNVRPIGLNAEQKAKLQNALKDSSELRALADKLVAAHHEALKVALDKDATDAAVREKIEAVSKIQTEITMTRYRIGVKAVLPSLSDEQKKQMLDGSGASYNQLFTGNIFGSVIVREGNFGIQP
jgi:hypothetical protein